MSRRPLAVDDATLKDTGEREGLAPRHGVPHPAPVAPPLSIVVVAYDMARELPRTLRSLLSDYQRGVEPANYEIVVVDNGSPEPVEDVLPARMSEAVRLVRIDPAPASPARAANAGIDEARGELVGLIVDGARMASPGLLAHALLARRLSSRPVVASPGYHLGSVRHMDAAVSGYDQAAEDRLLAEIDWELDGYRLFARSILANSSGRGWFGPMGESSALFLPAALWDELGGLDEAFALPGGGLVNHDLYRRACSLPDVDLVVLVGEGTFHQFHGGASTGGSVEWDEMQSDYESHRGERYRPPTRDPIYLGGVPSAALGHLAESVRLAQVRAERDADGRQRRA